MKAVRFGEDGDRAEKRMERVIVSWLKRKLAADPAAARRRGWPSTCMHSGTAAHRRCFTRSV
jgi:hypothetical protein